MSLTIRRWSFVLPRLRWAWRERAPLECMTMEQVAHAFPQWGSAEVRSSHVGQPGLQRPFTRDEIILMERMGRVR